jgi:hypothetical protein
MQLTLNSSQAARTNDAPQIQSLLKQGGVLIDATDEQGYVCALCGIMRDAHPPVRAD